MPFYRARIEINEPVSPVYQRIWDAVSLPSEVPVNLLGLNPPPRPFIGFVDGSSFRIHRAIRYRNTFLPWIWGRLIPTSTGTRVDLTMVMNPYTLVFLLLFSGFIAYGTSISDRPSAASWGVSALFLGVSSIAFFVEAAKAESLLRRIVLNEPQAT